MLLQPLPNGRAVVDAGAGDRRSDGAAFLTAAVVVVALGLVDGGYFPQTQAWAALLLAWALAMTVLVRDTIFVRALGVALLAALGALGLWTLLSAWWSLDSSASLRDAQRVLLYAVAVAVVLLVAGPGRAAPLLGGAFLGIAVVTAVALIGYLVFQGGVPAHPVEGFLLHEPVGYANSLGLLVALGVVLALGFVTYGPSLAVRSVCAATLGPFAAALFLTSSRGAWASLAGALAVWLALEGRRAGRTITICAISAAAGIALAARAGLGDAPLFDVDEGRRLAAALLLLAAATGAFAAWTDRAGRPPRSQPLGNHSALVVAATLTAAAVVVAAAGIARAPWLGDRIEYWRVAWHAWLAQPLDGWGAGSFAVLWVRSSPAVGARDAHNLYLETLAELGVIGLVLVVASVTVPLFAARNLGGHRLAPTALCAYLAWVIHAGVDWDWEMPATTLGALFSACALIVSTSDGRAVELTPRRRRVAVAVAAAAVAASCAALVASGAVRL